MRYFFDLEDSLVPLEDFTATLPQEEHTFQTFIDRTDEIPTGRIIPGRFTWNRSENEPEVRVDCKFCVITEDYMALTCQRVAPDIPYAGNVIECTQLAPEQKEKIKALLDAYSPISDSVFIAVFSDAHAIHTLLPHNILNFIHGENMLDALFEMLSEIFSAFMEADTHAHGGIPFKERFKHRKYRIILVFIAIIILAQLLIVLF